MKKFQSIFNIIIKLSRNKINNKNMNRFNKLKIAKNQEFLVGNF